MSMTFGSIDDIIDMNRSSPCHAKLLFYEHVALPRWLIEESWSSSEASTDGPQTHILHERSIVSTQQAQQSIDIYGR